MQKEKVDLSEFYRSFLTIGIPLMIQQLISSSLNFIDNLMIGRLGTEFIAAVGFANSVYRILDLFLFGLCSGMGVFIAQYFGKKNFEMIRRILGKLVLAGITLSLIFSIITFIGAEKIIGIFTKEPQVLAIGVSYIRRALFSYTFYAISFSVGFCLRAMGLTRIPMISASIGVTANTFFNYCLIYGNFGFPRLEERGAALATVMARMLELSTILFIVYKKDFNLKGNLQSYLNLPKALMKEIIKISTPVFLTEMLWILGVVSLSVAYSRLGTTQAACVQIADIITAISSVLFMGISNSASVIIGHTIGKGDKNKVIAYSRKILQIAFGMAIVSLMLVQGLTNTIVSLYHLPPETHIMAVRTMRTVGMFVFLKMINWTLLIGLFRAGEIQK